MKIKVDWEKPLIDKEDVFKISESDLNDFYTSGDDFDKFNIYFVLLNSLNSFKKVEQFEEAAHIAFLISYYLFILLTPPASMPLALNYIDEAIELDDKKEYRDFKELVKEGN